MRDNGQIHDDTHALPADPARLHSSMGHYARILWDIQKTRIGLTNRVDAMRRDDIPEPFFETALKTGKSLTATEEAIDRHLEKLAKQHFMADWIAEAPGIGLPGFARLLGVTGSLDRFPNVAKLWKYLGLHTVDGESPKRRKGESWTHTNCKGGHLLNCKPGCKTDHHPNCTPDGIGSAYSPQGRVVCHQLGESIVKVGRGRYREAYDIKKRYYELNRSDWTQARRHNAAMRYAVKELVKDLWVEWHRQANSRVSPTFTLPAA